MNNTKKALKPQNKEPKIPLSQRDGIGKRIFVIISLVILVTVVVAVAWEGLAPKYLLSIDGKKMKQSDLIYEIYSAESMGAYMANLYAQFGYTDSYWTMDMGDGNTAQDDLRTEAINQAVETTLLYKEALSKGYTATEEEITKAEESADSTITQVGESKAKNLGMTREFLVDRILQETVSVRYKQDMIDGFAIDDEAIKATVDYDTYRGYEAEYFYIPTTTSNDAGEQVDIADKSQAKADIEAALAKAKTSDDWSKVIDAEDENATVQYKKNAFTKESEDVSEETLKLIMDMKNGDVTEVIEEQADGYYVFRMVNNESSSEYDSQVEQAITDKENEEFNVYLTDLKEQHTIKVYDSNWKSVVFGSVTL